MTYELKKISSVCVIEKDGKYLFVKRAHTGMADGFYMLPELILTVIGVALCTRVPAIKKLFV